ncbi:uncharacterized protein LOC105439448 isoform X2 [Strongylocentrotus purpuratus]|nr:uncharacterized protein LOC105439448 isoform X2 [Strongylocentrotus purpuratus]
MQTQRKLFLDSLTQENIDHIWLKCLIRVHYEARFSVRFMYTNDYRNGPFQEMTPDVFKMRTYHNRASNRAHPIVEVQILGRYDGKALPLYYTCDTVSDSKVSGYGYEITRIQYTTNIVEPTYYWTKFFDEGPPVDGEESETKESHKALAIADGYDLFCDSPVYAECRLKATVSSTASVPWYDATPTFVPQYDFPCNRNGIRCTSQVDKDTNQTCPDLEVRYACCTPSEDLTEAPPPTQSNSEQPSIVREPSDSVQEEPSTTPPTGHDQQATRATRAPGTNKDTKEPFQKVIKNNLNWIYPVAIVVFGAGIPVIISCYFLWRKKTPEEIEEEILAAEKKEAAKRPTSARGKP